MQIRPNTLFLIALTCLAIITFIDGDPSKDILSRSTHRFSTRINILTDGKEIQGETKLLNEIYSDVPKRFKLIFDGSNDRVNYVGSEKVTVKLSDSEKCSVSSSADLLKDLFWSGFPVNDWLMDRPDVPKHVVGPARIAYILRANRASLSQSERASVTVRGEVLQAFQFKLKLDSGEAWDIRAFYLETGSQLEVPRQVLISFTGGRLLRIEFSLIENFSGLEFFRLSGLSDHWTDYSFPIGRGCAKQMLEQLGRLDTFVTPKYSFIAQVYDGTTTQARKSRFFFAYDSELRVSRLDKLVTVQRSDSTEPEILYSVTINDERDEMIYNFEKPVELAGEQGKTSEHQSCVSVRSQSFDPQLKFFVPYHELVEMGIGYARGFRVRIFESTSDELPIFFMAAADESSGALKLDYDRAKELLKNAEKPAKPMTVVYMLSDQVIEQNCDQTCMPFGIPLRILIISGGTIFFQIELFDFSWSIQQSPNGDSRFDLFSLEQKCCHLHGACGPTRRGQLNALFEYKVDEKLSQILDIETAMSLLPKSPLARNLDFVRAMVVTESVSATQIHDANTKLIRQQDRLLVEFNAHLSRPKVPAFWTAEVGFAVGWSLNKLSVNVVASMRECYWRALRRQSELGQAKQILFAYCSERCLIDENARRDSDQEPWRTSFKLVDERGFCVVYKIDELGKHSSVEKIRKNWAFSFTKLTSKVLHLGLSDRFDQTGTTKYLLFNALSVDVKSDRWHASEGHEGSADPTDSGSELDSAIADAARTTLTGVGLLAKQDGGAGEPVSAPTSGAMNLARCHAACLARLTCNSFSLCDTRTGRQCMTSELSFEQDPSLLATIDETKSKMKLSGGQEVSFTYNPLDSQSTGASSSSSVAEVQSNQVKFIIHAKCQITERKSLEMFSFGKSYTAKLNTKHSLARYSAPRWVENEQQCASLCLNRNMALVRRRSRSNANPESLVDFNPSSVWCLNFIYIDEALSKEDVEVMPPPSSLTPNWNKVCILAGLRPPESKSVSPLSTGVETKRQYLISLFNFVHSNLFERINGLKMAAQAGNKQLYLSYNNVETCAKRCFLQMDDIEPCRSFDFIRVITSANSSPFFSRFTLMQAYCILNSMTLAEVQASGSVEAYQTGEGILVTHFEPLEALSFKQAQDIKRESITEVDSADEQPSGYLGSFLALVLAMITGITLGVLLFGRVQAHLHVDHTGDSRVPHQKLEQDLDILGPA